MNPTKKPLDGWILCPSKSFPGKFYYFNVANGETAWSLNEIEKSSLKDPRLQKVDTPHCYPEPISPPVDQTPLTPNTGQPNISSQDISLNYPRNISSVSTLLVQPHAFGQPNYLRPNPIQIQVPMIIGSEYQNNPQVLMVLMNQTATNQLAIQDSTALGSSATMEPDRELFLQRGKTPLCKRFVNYENTVINFSKDNKIRKLEPHQSFNTSTPNKLVAPNFSINQSAINNSLPMINHQISANHVSCTKTQSNLIRKPVFTLSPKRKSQPSNANIFSPRMSQNIYNTQSISPRNNFDARPNYIQQNSANQGDTQQQRNLLKHLAKPKATLTQRPTFAFQTNNPPHLDHLEVPSSMENDALSFDENYMEKATLPNCNKVENTDELQNLGTNDLRRILVAKRRKSMDVDRTEITETKKIKTYKPKDVTTVATKKKVTFNPVPESYSDIVSAEVCGSISIKDEESTQNDVEDTMVEQHIISPSKRRERWYVVVDTKVLIEEFDILEHFVQLDPKCHLLIPSRVVSDTVALSRFECQERRYVTLARHLLRRLETPRPYITAQSPNKENVRTRMSLTDAILHCCLNIIEENSYVILITNNDDLKIKAKILKIDCFNTDQIKESMAKEPEVLFDIKKIKISITNIPETNETNEHLLHNTSDRNNKNCIKTQYNSGEATWNRSQNKNSIDKSGFQIQNVQNQTTLKKVANNVPNSNVSRLFQSKNQPEINKYQNSVQNEKNQVSSIFKLGNENMQHKMPHTKSKFEIDSDVPKSQRSSIFEIDGIEKIETRSQMKPIFDDNYKPKTQKPSIFKDEKNKNKTVPSKKSVFEIDQNPINNLTRQNEYQKEAVKPKPSIFDNVKHKIDNPTKPSVFEIDRQTKASIFDIDRIGEPALPTMPQSKAAILEQYLNGFCAKTEIDEDMIKKRREEFVCTFKQVMEDCLSQVLQHFVYILKCKPPWSLDEVLQCMTEVYDYHTNLLTSVRALVHLLETNNIDPKGIVKIIGCGMVLLRHLKKIKTTNQEVMLDAENSLNTILKNMIQPNLHMDVLPLRTPVFSRTDIETEGTNYRRNFVKNRSEVLKYLKKHFPAWTDYDETLEEINSNTEWGQSNKEVKVLRTLGKDLNLLKINQYKTMSLKKPNDNKAKDENQKDPNEITQKKIKINRNKNKTELKTCQNINNDVTKIVNPPENLIENCTALKITRTFENASKMPLKVQIPQNKPSEMALKEAGPKVIRLFNNIDTKKEQKDTGKSIVNLDFATTGHSFGTNETGPKVVRNIQLIDAFEKKINLKRVTLDLDKLDYSDMSKSDDDKELETNIENLEDNKQIILNDHLMTSEEKSSKNDTKFENNSYATNNESHSMSLDNCVTNEYSINDTKNDTQNYIALSFDDILPKNDAYSNNAYSPINNAYAPTNNAYSPINNAYVPTSNAYSVTNNAYAPKNNAYAPKNNAYAPTNNAYSAINNAYVPTSNAYSLTNNAYSPTNNAYSPTNNAYSPTNNAYSPTNDGYMSTNYNNLPTNDNLSINDNYFSSDCASFGKKCDDYTDKDYRASIETNDSCNKPPKDDMTNDSGFENESTRAYSLVQSFLCEVNGSFKLVHKFIEDSAQEFRDNNLMETRRNSLHTKADAVHKQIATVIDKLQSILQRESGDETPLRSLLSHAASPADNDKWIASYRKIVTKCLGQAEMLDKALSIMLSMTNGKKKIAPSKQSYHNRN